MEFRTPRIERHLAQIAAPAQFAYLRSLLAALEAQTCSPRLIESFVADASDTAWAEAVSRMLVVATLVPADAGALWRPALLTLGRAAGHPALAEDPVCVHRLTMLVGLLLSRTPAAPHTLLLANTLAQRLAEPADSAALLATLAAAAHAAPRDAWTVLEPAVTQALAHPSAQVRHRAVLVLSRFAQIDAARFAVPLGKRVRRLVADPAVEVLGAMLAFYRPLCRRPETLPAVAKMQRPLLHILVQIAEQKLPPMYHRRLFMAPWYEATCVEILLALCKARLLEPPITLQLAMVAAQTLRAMETKAQDGTDCALSQGIFACYVPLCFHLDVAPDAVAPDEYALFLEARDSTFDVCMRFIHSAIAHPDVKMAYLAAHSLMKLAEAPLATADIQSLAPLLVDLARRPALGVALSALRGLAAVCAHQFVANGHPAALGGGGGGGGGGVRAMSAAASLPPAAPPQPHALPLFSQALCAVLARADAPEHPSVLRVVLSAPALALPRDVWMRLLAPSLPLLGEACFAAVAPFTWRVLGALDAEARHAARAWLRAWLRGDDPMAALHAAAAAVAVQGPESASIALSAAQTAGERLARASHLPPLPRGAETIEFVALMYSRLFVVESDATAASAVGGAAAPPSPLQPDDLLSFVQYYHAVAVAAERTDAALDPLAGGASGSPHRGDEGFGQRGDRAAAGRPSAASAAYGPELATRVAQHVVSFLEAAAPHVQQAVAACALEDDHGPWTYLFQNLLDGRSRAVAQTNALLRLEGLLAAAEQRQPS